MAPTSETDRSTTEEQNEQYSLIIESFAVVSSKSIDNQSMGEEKEGKKKSSLLIWDDNGNTQVEANKFV